MDLKCKECGVVLPINNDDDNLVVMGYCLDCGLYREKEAADKIIQAIKEARALV
jgi:hypothetical protein